MKDPLARIRNLYHFTNVRNLVLIRENGGIYSAAKLRKLGIDFVPGGNDWSLKQDIRLGLDHYVHLCWAHGHPMEWHIRQRDESARMKYLEVDRSIMNLPDVMFSPGVSNAVGVGLIPVLEAVEREMIDFEALYGNIGSLREQGPQARRQAAERSEILIPNLVPLDFIRNLRNG